MPKIIFWNIARSGGGLLSEVTDNLDTDISGLCGEYNPDFIVLCEAQKGTRKNFRDKIPHGYSAPKFVKTASSNPPVLGFNQNQLGDYRDQDTLRYIFICKGGVTAYLLPSVNKRPSVAFQAGGRWVIALHAPSAGQNTITPQCAAIAEAHDSCAALFAQPSVVLGDLNMDLSAVGKKAAITQKLLNTHNVHPGILDPAVKTHRHGPDQPYTTTLDWAIKTINNNAFQPTVQAILPSSGSGSDDDDFTPEFENAKQSDHRPIMVRW